MTRHPAPARAVLIAFETRTTASLEQCIVIVSPVEITYSIEVHKPESDGEVLGRVGGSCVNL